MTEVTIDSKSLVDRLGQGAQSGSRSYAEETAGAQRDLNLKIEGQSSEALEAFVEKLNHLSAQVFTNYPKLLRDFSKLISDYLTAIEGVGFSSEQVYTRQLDIDEIIQWLKNDRYQSIEEKGEALERVLKKASAILSQTPKPRHVEAGDTRTIVLDAGETLRNLAKNREHVNTTLTTALDTLLTKLLPLEQELTQTLFYLRNSGAIGQISAETTLNWLVTGSLTAENMHYLDYLLDRHDGQVLEGFLLQTTDQKRMEAVASVDPQYISPVMMNFIYERLHQHLIDYHQTGHEDSLRALDNFLVTMTDGRHKDEQVAVYMEKLLDASARYAGHISNRLQAQWPVLPHNATQAQVAQYKSDFESTKADILQQDALNLKYARSLDGLFNVIQRYRMGKYELPMLAMAFDNQRISERLLGIESGSLQFEPESGDLSFETIGTETWEVERGESWVHLKTETIGTAQDSTSRVRLTFQDNAETISNVHDSQNLEQLAMEKERAQRQFWRNIGISASDALPLGFDIAAKTVLHLGNMGDGQPASIISAVGDSGNLPIEGYQTQVAMPANIAVDFIDHYTTSSQIDEGIKVTDNSIRSNLFNIGGVTYTEGDRIQGGFFQPDYDLEAIAYGVDLNKNGIRGYQVRSADTIEDATYLLHELEGKLEGMEAGHYAEILRGGATPVEFKTLNEALMHLDIDDTNLLPNTDFETYQNNVRHHFEDLKQMID